MWDVGIGFCIYDIHGYGELENRIQDTRRSGIHIFLIFVIF